ncbi:MAG TPA: SDR family oxidoreductase [Rhodothermales bacterium]|nr:SDR family oxidoreductase [Rhodothermales bacterium]
MSIVVVTGASQGIGRAIAETFARETGARIALIARNEKGLRNVADRCTALGAEAAVFPCDVTDEEAVNRTADAILQRWGAPDVLVNNAGSFAPGGLLAMTPATFREQIDVNLVSAFLVSRAFLEPMIQAGRGTLFFMGSVASIQAYPDSIAYCAAKHGLLGLARVIREETRERNIRVTTLLPGATYTASWQGSGLPEERFMPPEDIARAVLDVYRLDPRTVVEEILLRPQLGDV